MRSYSEQVPDVDPISNPVGFWVFFGVSLLLVIVLAAAPLFWVVSMIRQSRDRPDPKKAAVERQFDQVYEAILGLMGTSVRKQ